MRPRLPLLVAGALAFGGLAWNLGGYPLLEPDEGRNAEVMREMAAGGPWWLPRLNDLPYVDKPIVHFAAGALALRLGGRTEAAARLPSLAFTLATLGVVWWFARRTIGPGAAWPAVIAAAAMPFTLAYARTVICDAAVTLWITVAITAFACAVEAAERNDPHRSRWTRLGWAALALGVLTKGPVAIAVPLLVTVPYAAWRRRPGSVLDPAGMLLFLAAVLPWLFAVSTRVPDFLQYVLFVETAERVSADTLGRTEPWWYFLPVLAGAAFPWTAALVAAVRPGWSALRRRAMDPRVVLFVSWVVIPLLLFSLSRSKRPQYVLPLMPPIALLCAMWWDRHGDHLPGARLAGSALAALGAVLLALASRIPAWVDASPAVATTIPGTARWLGAVALAGGVGGIALARRREWSLLSLVLPVAVIPLLAMPLMDRIGADRSSRAVAEAIRPVLSEETEVVAVGTYPLSLPFYLDRTLTLVTADARELTSNYLIRNHKRLRGAPRSTLRPPDWWEEALALCERPRVFVVPLGSTEVRRRLESALPLRALSRKVAVYGPCGPGTLARRS